MKRTAVWICALMACAHMAVGQGKKAAMQQVVTPITIGEAHKLQSVILAEERVLNVYLPDGYDAADTVKYPVIYLLDGGVDEDFIHIAGLVQFCALPWVGRLPKCIVVGIANTDRKRDMTSATMVASDKKKYPTTGGSAQFISFLEREVQPYIKQHFRTGGNKILIGQSLAGLLATEVLFSKPGLFDKYIIISPSLWWNNGALLKKPFSVWNSLVTAKTDIYIGVGKEGLAPSAEPHVMEVDANLLKDKIDSAHNKNIHVYFDYLPNENHATITHQAVINAIGVLYGAGK